MENLREDKGRERGAGLRQRARTEKKKKKGR